MKIETTRKSNQDNWVKGLVNDGEYKFEAKVFDVGSIYGIDEGKVSKLAIWDENKLQQSENFFDACIVNYDRGWDIEPTKDNKDLFKAVLNHLEKSL